MQLVAFLFVTGAFSIRASQLTFPDIHAVRADTSDHIANRKDWPWIAAIYHVSDNIRTFKCAGALIHSKIVLTSATCVFKDGQRILPQKIQVELGTLNVNEIGFNGQAFQVQKIVSHSFFNASSKLENNIAIIRLSNEATLNDYVQPVRISNRTQSPEMINDEPGTVVGWDIVPTSDTTIEPQRTGTLADVTLQKALMSTKRSGLCQEGTVLPDGCYCAAYRDGMRFGNADYAAMMAFKENGESSIRGIVSKVLSEDGHAAFTDVPTYLVWIQEVAPELKSSKETNVSACRSTEEFVIDPYRCEETCEKFGNPICVEYAAEGRCYCKDGFVRLTTVGICVTADNRACRAKMPPTNETCEQRQNEHLSEWLHDEPCANTCENYNVPCNVSAPTGMFWGPHCVCKDGFARLPNGKCVAIDDPKCKVFWNPVTTTSTTPQTTTTPRPTTTQRTTPVTTPTRVWIQEVAPELKSSKEANVSACRPTEEFVTDPYRCEETCEKFGNPICVEYAAEGRCYCKDGFVRLTTAGICVTADNRACRAKMPPTNETCEQRQNEHLSEWLHDEPCANTCENYNVPCNVSAPTGMFWGPHCVCKDGFARLPNGKCVAIDDPKCKVFWNPVTTTSTTPQTTTTPRPTTTQRTTPVTTPKPKSCKNFCGHHTSYIDARHNCPQFDLGMQWSSAGPISGKHCTQVIEIADPHTWLDNYICFNANYGVRWSSAGAINGMDCTQLLEVADPFTWHDNYLCVPNNSRFRFRWSSSGTIAGLCCVQTYEPADPHTWFDNYLCVA